MVNENEQKISGDRNVERKKKKKKTATTTRHNFCASTWNLCFFILVLDFDECYNNLCQNGGKCTNTNGDYICECKPGYSGKNCHLGKVQPQKKGPESNALSSCQGFPTPSLYLLKCSKVSDIRWQR